MIAWIVAVVGVIVLLAVVVIVALAVFNPPERQWPPFLRNLRRK